MPDACGEAVGTGEAGWTASQSHRTPVGPRGVSRDGLVEPSAVSDRRQAPGPSMTGRHRPHAPTPIGQPAAYQRGVSCRRVGPWMGLGEAPTANGRAATLRKRASTSTKIILTPLRSPVDLRVVRPCAANPRLKLRRKKKRKRHEQKARKKKRRKETSSFVLPHS